MDAVVELDALSVLVGDRVLVDRVSLTVAEGERVALVGRSGSGKSLTAAAVCGSLSPVMRTTGTVRVATRRGRPDVALVQQDSSSALHPLVAVGPQLVRPLRSRGTSRPEAAARARDLLRTVGLDDPDRVLAAHPAELSGGQRQRVCIALALACRSRLLVADEPTTALDVVNQARVVDALTAVGSAQLFITHDLAVAARLCTRVVVLDAGRVVEDAPTERLVAAATHPVTRDLVARARGAWTPASAGLTGLAS